MLANRFALKRLDGKDTLIIHHVGLRVAFLGQGGGTGIDVGHAVFFLHGKHMGVTVDEQVALLVRREAVEVEKMAARLGELFPGAAVIRIMPNTPVAVGQGMIQYCHNALATKEQIDAFLYAMQHAGKVGLLDEDLFDAATAVSGCGPAFAYLFADALAKGGADCGLPYETAAEYAAQMLLGAALMLQNDPRTPEELRQAVCSPGGSTIEGVKVMWEMGLEDTVRDAVKASYERNKQLGKS